MSPTEEMKLRKEQADRELALAIKLANEEIAGLTAEATSTMADLEHVNPKALKDHVVTLKAAAASVESRVAMVLSAVKRRRTCF